MYSGGKGHYLTVAEVIQQKQKLEEDKEQEEIKKKQQKVAKESWMADKERIEQQWKEIIEGYSAYAHKVAKWEEQCKRLREQYVIVKNLPKRPKQPSKPKLREGEDGQHGNEEEDGDR
jgi:GTP cyclohydrolase I